MKVAVGDGVVVGEGVAEAVAVATGTGVVAPLPIEQAERKTDSKREKRIEMCRCLRIKFP